MNINSERYYNTNITESVLAINIIPELISTAYSFEELFKFRYPRTEIPIARLETPVKTLYYRGTEQTRYKLITDGTNLLRLYAAAIYLWVCPMFYQSSDCLVGYRRLEGPARVHAIPRQINQVNILDWN